MSQNYHQGLLSFSNGIERPQDEQQQYIAHHVNQEKLRVQDFEPPPPLVAIEGEEESSGIQVYHEATGMLSEMFNNGNEWFDNRHDVITGGSLQVPVGDTKNNRNSITTTEYSMQLFLMNPQPKSPTLSPSHPTITSTLQGFPNPDGGHFGHVICEGASRNVIEGQGLSLSLSSSLQHLEATKMEELRVNGGGMLFFNNQGSSQNNHHQVHVGFGSSLGLVNVLRNSKYAKATQELLEEFCSVGRGHFFKKNKVSRDDNTTIITNPNSNNPRHEGNNNNNSSSSKDDLPLLSAADRLKHQRRKVKLLSMLDEVDKRYNHYCEQMQMVVNLFDLIMGFGSAIPYTSLAQKAMSRHFKCLKDAITTQLKKSCELIGEKDATNLGLTKGETPRLKILEQSLRQQRAFHQQMGMMNMEPETWRPQRGLPEKSVNILRAWLFEHFLHPYPSDADKSLLARQTGLSKNQISNWFINARVRLWKPMVEDMYQQEAKEEEENAEDDIIEKGQNQNSSHNNAQIPQPSNTNTTAPATITDKKSKINAPENDPSILSINRHHESTAAQHNPATITCHRDDMFCRDNMPDGRDNTCCRDEVSSTGTTNVAGNSDVGSSTMITFGTSTVGDVSLTLGLHHAGNLSESNQLFS